MQFRIQFFLLIPDKALHTLSSEFQFDAGSVLDQVFYHWS